MLEAINLSKSYNGTPALKNLNLCVSPGEIFCLLGQNGAGKTTTINLFLGFIEPTSGEAKVDNISVKAQPLETKKRLAYIPETVMLYPNLTGLENLEYFATLSGKTYSQAQLSEFLLQAGLEQDAHHIARQHEHWHLNYRTGFKRCRLCACGCTLIFGAWTGIGNREFNKRRCFGLNNRAVAGINDFDGHGLFKKFRLLSEGRDGNIGLVIGFVVHQHKVVAIAVKVLKGFAFCFHDFDFFARTKSIFYNSSVPQVAHFDLIKCSKVAGRAMNDFFAHVKFTVEANDNSF